MIQLHYSKECELHPSFPMVEMAARTACLGCLLEAHRVYARSAKGTTTVELGGRRDTEPPPTQPTGGREEPEADAPDPASAPTEQKRKRRSRRSGS